ncbi:ATP cone domain-containing protein [Escherichia coli]
MKRDGCKVPFKSERIKEAILRAAKQRKSMMPIIAPLLPRLSASRCRAATRWISTRSRPQLKTS